MSAELEIRIEGVPLDLLVGEESRFYLTKVVHDLTNLQTRNSDFSKSIPLPITPRNLQILGDNVPALERHSIDPVGLLDCEVLIKGVPVLDDAQLLIGTQSIDQKTLTVSVIAGTAKFFNQLEDIPIANLNLSEYNIEWSLAGIVPIVQATEGITYAQSLWYSNTSRDLFDAQGGDGTGFTYLDHPELGESGFFIYFKTILEKIFFNLNQLTVDMSLMDEQFNQTCLACAVPIVHDSFTGVDGYFVDVADGVLIFDQVIYDQVVNWNTVVEDDELLFLTPKVTIKEISFVIIKADFQVVRNQEQLYYTRIQIRINGNIHADAQFSAPPNGSTIVECSIETSANVNVGDFIEVWIANQQGAFIITSPDTSGFTVEAQGSSRGRSLDVASQLPEISQREFVKNVFQLFNIVPTSKNNVVTLNYWDNIKNIDPIVFDIDRSKPVNVQTSMISYGQTNFFKYAENEAVLRLDSHSQFPVNSTTIAKFAVKIESLFSATDGSNVPNVEIAIPNYELTYKAVTDNKITISQGSPNYSTADRNDIELGDFIYVTAGGSVRKRVIGIIDDFSGVCDANFESNAPSFDWEYWRYAKNDLLLQIATVKPSLYRMQVWDGGFIQNYDDSNVASFEDLRFENLQFKYYSLLVDTAFKPFVVTAWVSLELIKFISINGLQPIYVESLEAYFYANKIEQWKYNGSTRVQLIQINI